MRSEDQTPPASIFKIRALEHPENNAFGNDILRRKGETEYLLSIIETINEPAVIAVTGGFGTGKSYFLKGMKIMAEEKERKTFTFDAWEFDSSDNPYSAFCSQILSALAIENKAFGLIEKAKLVAGSTSKVATTVGMGLVARYLIGDAAAKKLEEFEFSEEKFENALIKIGEDAFNKVGAQQQAETDFKHLFSNLVKEQCDGKLIVFIDELDRCQPDFALTLLERIKHLFSVRGVVFIIAIDQDQIGSLIDLRYGKQRRKGQYLRKFVDWQYSLKKPSRVNYISNIAKNTLGFESIYSDWMRFYNPFDLDTSLQILALLSEAYDLSYREMNQLITAIYI